MGHTHGTLWTEEKVISGIYGVMKFHGIKRMPSRTEIEKCTCDSGLTGRISKTGGFYAWAEKLGLEIKQCETKLGVDNEIAVCEKLKALGYEAELTSVKSPYDILVNGRTKIDVKCGKAVNYGNGLFFTYNLEKKQPTCDLYAAVRLNENGEVLSTYIIPASIMNGKSQLSMGCGESKYDKYAERWDLVKKVDDAFKQLESA